MKNLAFVSIFAAALLAASCAQAADIGVSAEVGSTGLGVHISTSIASQLNARIGVNYASHSYSGNTSDVDYDFKLKLATFDALLDYYPMDGVFRVTGGLVYNGNKIEANAKANGNGTFTVNNNSYAAATAGTIAGTIDFRKAAPYVGIGWGNSAKNAGWGFAMDLGALIQGSPKAALSNTGCTASAAQCTQLSSDVAAESAKLEDQAHNFKAYPVVRLGVSYRF